MASWFSKSGDPPKTADVQDAFQAGREDERTHAPERAAPAVDDVEASKVFKDAYERGRRDERARRPRFSLVSIALLVVAIAGGGIIYLAAREGSFSQGGALVDRNISTAADKAQAPVRQAADRAGDALENAGKNLKDQAK